MHESLKKCQVGFFTKATHRGENIIRIVKKLDEHQSMLRRTQPHETFKGSRNRNLIAGRYSKAVALMVFAMMGNISFMQFGEPISPLGFRPRIFPISDRSSPYQ